MLLPMGRALTVVLVTALAATWGPAVQATIDLKVGDAAPAFSLPGSDGITYRLADYKGKRAVVLAWFAKAFTGG